MKIDELGIKLGTLENIETSVYGIKVRPILNQSELGVIVENALQIDDVVSRDMCINIMVLKMVADIEIENADEYNKLMEIGLIDDVLVSVSNYNTIAWYIHEANDLGNVVRIGLNKLVEKLPDEKGLSKLITKMTKAIKETAK